MGKQCTSQVTEGLIYWGIKKNTPSYFPVHNEHKCLAYDTWGQTSGRQASFIRKGQFMPGCLSNLHPSPWAPPPRVQEKKFEKGVGEPLTAFESKITVVSKPDAAAWGLMSCEVNFFQF